MDTSTTRRALLAGGMAIGALGCGATGPEAPEPPAQRPPRGGDGEPADPSVRRREETFQGKQRVVYFQEAKSTPAPILMALHGHGGGPNVMIERYGVASGVARMGWFGVYPQTGEDVNTDHHGGDHEFLSHLLREAAERRPIERRFVLGFSGGAHKTYQIAARDSDTVDAIVAVSGKAADADNPYDKWDPNVTRPSPLSILHVHGLRDETVPFEGGLYGHGEGTGRRSIGIQQGLDAWIRWLGAKPVASPARSDVLPPEVRLSRWEAPGGHAIELLVHPQMGHEYPREWLNRYAFAFLAAVPRRG